MKFAKLFEQVLQEEGIPPEWVHTAIQYKSLKKCINRIVDELDEIGLKKKTLSFLLEDGIETDDEFVKADYIFEKHTHSVKPKLIITLRHNAEDNNGELCKDKMTQEIKATLQNIMDNELGLKNVGKVEKYIPKIVEVDNDDNQEVQIVIHLYQDSIFFQMLYQELAALDDLKNSQESKMIQEVQDIGSIIGSITSPTLKKTDLLVWREIFKMYIDSEIFFSTSEFSPGERSVAQSEERLELFFRRIKEKNMLKEFHHKVSVECFNNFYKVNIHLLKALQFQTFNKMAIFKILKKFDKQTSLKGASGFPKLIEHDPFIKESFAHTMCAVISSRLLNIIPQLDDYTCPICCSVTFKPIRLDCGHVFCVRCLVKMQRKRQDNCPLCREKVVMRADEHNLDLARLEYLKLYFPKETKAKQLETEKEIAKEQFEAIYGDQQRCIIQ
ncbi:hypothetical protein PACTADRAFT_31507 [Pachysolen tannophilus NRRL Y-2460]|uniref:RING-type domain-containing protein n=1 Tax=Pachysolen tannophilus NRRL Y-2460 TaxID=669874 RepID=A0A1E4U265_PACTA|nr:hypothetical protein PACTADRAFT_31507 [Pachysolen tannophilus NRRL Y-2460]